MIYLWLGGFITTFVIGYSIENKNSRGKMTKGVWADVILTAVFWPVAISYILAREFVWGGKDE